MRSFVTLLTAVAFSNYFSNVVKFIELRQVLRQKHLTNEFVLNQYTSLVNTDNTHKKKYMFSKVKMKQFPYSSRPLSWSLDRLIRKY